MIFNSQAPVSQFMAHGPILRRSSFSLASYLKSAKNDSPWNQIFFFLKTSLAVWGSDSEPNGLDTIILQKNFGLIIHFMVFTRFQMPR